MNSVENEDVGVVDYLKVMLRYWWVLIVTPLLLGGAVYGLLSLQTPLYDAQVRILVQQSSGSNVQSLTDVDMNVALIKTYTAIVGSGVVLERVGLSLTPDELAHFEVSAESQPGTQIMIIRSRHPVAAHAATTANTVAESFIAYIRESQLTALAELLAAATLQGVSVGDSADLFAAQIRTAGAFSIIDRASPPSTIVTPQLRRGTALALFLGAILALPIAFGLSRLKNKVESLDLLEHRFGMVPLGAIGYWKSTKINLRFLIDPTSNQTDVEQFRSLRANIQFRLSSLGATVIAVSSAGAGEGKSTISTNLAGIIAFGGKKVLVIDADMRRPSVHSIFETTNDSGLSNYLAGIVTDPDEIIRETGVEGLSFIPSGPLPPNPTELLASATFHRLLEAARERWDIVIIDTPSVLAVADTTVIVSQVDGMLLVVERRKTKISAFAAMIKRLNLSSAEVLGVVLNMALASNSEYGGYYYTSADEKPKRRGLQKLRWW